MRMSDSIRIDQAMKRAVAIAHNPRVNKLTPMRGKKGELAATASTTKANTISMAAGATSLASRRMTIGKAMTMITITGRAAASSHRRATVRVFQTFQRVPDWTAKGATSQATIIRARTATTTRRAIPCISLKNWRN